MRASRSHQRELLARLASVVDAKVHTRIGGNVNFPEARRIKALFHPSYPIQIVKRKTMRHFRVELLLRRFSDHDSEAFVQGELLFQSSLFNTYDVHEFPLLAIVFYYGFNPY